MNICDFSRPGIQIISTSLLGLNITSISVTTHTFDEKNETYAVRINARIINNMFSECKIKFWHLYLCLNISYHEFFKMFSSGNNQGQNIPNRLLSYYELLIIWVMFGTSNVTKQKATPKHFFKSSILIKRNKHSIVAYW